MVFPYKKHTIKIKMLEYLKHGGKLIGSSFIATEHIDRDPVGCWRSWAVVPQTVVSGGSREKLENKQRLRDVHCVSNRP